MSRTAILNNLKSEIERSIYWENIQEMRQAKTLPGTYKEGRYLENTLSKNNLCIPTGTLSGHFELNGHLWRREKESEFRFCGE